MDCNAPSQKGGVRVFDHPKLTTTSRKIAEKWIKRRRAVYIDQEKTTVRFFAYEDHDKAPLQPNLSLGMRSISGWNGEDLPTATGAAISKARNEQARRERERKAVGSHTNAEWQEILERFSHRCLRCGIRADQTYWRRLTKDHVTPLASGGSDFASNIQPLCARCNAWKGNREIDFRSKYSSDRAKQFGAS